MLRGQQSLYHSRQTARGHTPSTPSQRSKYDSYTPRKRYMKGQEDYDQYFSNQRSRQEEPIASSRKTPTREPLNQVTFNPNQPSSLPRQLNEFDFNEGIGSYDMINCATSTRKPRLRQHLESKQVYKRLDFDQTENRDRGNIARPRMQKMDKVEPHQRFLDHQESLTPRRLRKWQEQNSMDLNDKMSMLQTKISKLERMGPRRAAAAVSTPRSSKIVESALPASLIPPPEPQTPTESIHSSRVSVNSASEREMELMSRVNLGRLVEEQECETEVEVIQDLSSRISAKLQSIIRNFGHP